MRHLVGLLLLTVLAGCGVTPPGPSPTSGSRTPALGPSASPAPVPSAPSPSAPSPPPTVPPSPSPTPLPNPGGTCSASQFVLGTATNGYTFGAAYWRHTYLDQRLRNAGGACVLNVPAMIGVASATGPFQAVRVNNVGYKVCGNSACHYVSPPSYKIRSGQSLTIGFDVSWWVGATDANGMPFETPPPCPGAVRDVTRVEVPLASGAITIDLETVWREVCAARDSISLTIKT
ncbi:MAG TPA: hypothetical protein VIK13_07400 [Candidatus Limnocylindrales bacterium]